MLQDQRMISDNNLMTVVNMLMTRMDRLEGKTTNYVDASANEWVYLRQSRVFFYQDVDCDEAPLLWCVNKDMMTC